MAAEGNRLPGELGLTSKQKKELENAALQSSLRGPGGGERAPWEGERPRGEGESAPGDEGTPQGGEQAPSEGEQDQGTDEDERPQDLPSGDRERTLTDHLNKRLLLSFQEKLNQAGDGLLQRVQQSQAGEDDNQAQEEW
ncbi:hypothetical protein NDU88_005950 [Pleurodeles waltl]|uniref:Uncharacterized protein n=1 Tax=Pleurodeles waltl TaxID=8319 RepID=A0AAV7L5Y9_PLEWA|nr:hypothetical protein NDU88_005950 [Pleurodeles waltl]